jgi:phage terminase large subunit
MYNLLPHQDDFLYSDFTHTGLVGGFGCGKSFIGVLKTTSKKMQYPGIDVAYYLPTYGLIKDIAFPKFKEVLENQNIHYTLNKSDYTFTTPFGRIIMRSTSNPEMIIGYEVGYSLVDEADVPSQKIMNQAFINIIARNRTPLPDKSINCTDFVSTPEGFKFLYNFFVKNKKDNRRLIKGRTIDNKHLPPSYIETLKESYTEQQIQAYLNGEFVNLTSGTVYHAFDRVDNHTDRTIQPRDVLHVGMDFNITKMSAVIHVVDSSTQKDIKREIKAIEEVTDAYDTADMIAILKRRYPNHKIVVYPDASGNNRKTSASDTDISLLKKAKFTVRVDKSNPSVRDRITSVNTGFKNAKGQTSYFVNTNNCPEYTEALEKLAYKNGAPDKESGFDHVTDGGGYAHYQINKGHKTFRAYAS